MRLRILTIFVLAMTLVATPLTAQELRDASESARAWLNDYRAKKNAPALGTSPQLTKAAAAHARDMARKGFFSHQGSDGSSVADRVRRQGYGYCFVAENIAKGQRDLGAVLQSWAGSKGHRRNMLSREARDFALVRGPDNIWVMVLGRPGC
ncbi:MAG: CAP domain-containing protein [Pseudomonadota bacterium]